MNSISFPPASRNNPLRVLIVARVSDPRPGKQDERSVQDQEDRIRSWLSDQIPGCSNVEVFASSGRGEWLDRAEFLDLSEKVESGRYDMVVTEDLGRIIRRMQAHMFAEECVDHGVRLIALNDHVDTAEPGWQDRSIFSAWHHERSNRDTSERIKRTHRARFQQGGCAAIPIYGYIKPPGARTDQDWQKDPQAEPIYREWFERLDRGDSFADIADWLNQQEVPTGPYGKARRWDGKRVAAVSRNTLLKGIRRRNDRENWRNSRGKYRTRTAPLEKLLIREVPHLAFFTADYYDRVIQQVNARTAKYSRSGKREDARRGVPRKKTRFPGQLLHCGLCGRLYVFGGRGQKEHPMCDGARQYRCWNGVTADGPLAAEKISAAVLAAIENLPEFDEPFLAEVHAEADRLASGRSRELVQLEARLVELDQQLDNLIAFVAGGCGSERVRQEIQKLEQARETLRADRQQLLQTPVQRLDIPSLDELKGLARRSMQALGQDSWDFCKLMHRLIPRIVVLPYRPCDGGTPVLRAAFRLRPSQLLGDRQVSQALSQLLERVLTVDLFHPPQRIACRERIRQGRESGLTERQAAEASRITVTVTVTVTAAQRAAALQRTMEALGLTDPYVPLASPPSDYPKLRRHLHPRYRFEPLPGAGDLSPA